MAADLDTPAVATPLGRLRGPAVAAAVGAAAVAAVSLRDPHVPGSWGVCPTLVVTGLYCPTCGGLRAVHELAHGRVVSALDSNALVVAAIAYTIVVWGLWVSARARGTGFAARRWLSPVVMGVVTVVSIVFMVLRNLPFGAVLAP